MMKTKILYLVLAVALVTLGAVGTAYAFHNGGVAECTGCHSMHSPKAGGVFLLQGTDQSSTCLNCHSHAGDTGPSSYHIATADTDMSGAANPPKQRTPGGDFGWLKKSYTWTAHGENFNETGASHGHNIVAVDFGYAVDPTNVTAPGGTFAASQLGCQSCHDPHSANRRLSDNTYVKPSVTLGTNYAPIMGSGSYGNSTSTPVTPPTGAALGVYRLLRGLGDNSQGVTFSGVAVAMAPSTYNQKEDTNQVRVAYGASGTNTWGLWCATCHPSMHSTGNYVHPIDQTLGTTYAANYNAYIGSGNLSGTSATAFLSLVPFIEGTGDIPTLASHVSNTGTYKNGPASTDIVACPTCHRAHASGWAEALRWNMSETFMVYNNLWPGTDNAAASYADGRVAAETQAAYYDRLPTTFATYQRVLCNKCHVKD